MKRILSLLTLSLVLSLTALAQGFAPVTNPTLPYKMTFAGTVVDLDRSDIQEKLDRELTSMVYTHGNTLLTIKRANRYFPMFEKVFNKNGVPLDMVYIACIESYLDPLAYSTAKAAGIWQFTEGTAKDYGLEVNDYVDERYDPEKAAEAACRYFKKAYDKYGNWESVAAAYNAGTNRISNAIADQGQSSAYDLYLNRETSRYIYRLLAMKAIMENPSEYGYRLKANQLYHPVEYDYVEVSTPVDSWVDWAKKQGMSYLQLREANPWIRNKSLPNKSGKTYKVAVLKDKSQKHSTIKPKVYNPNWVK